VDEAAPPLLEIIGLSAGYDGAPALDGVSLRLAAGEIVGLVGVNGAGKSTLLRTVIGLHRQTAGEIRLNGDVISDKPAHVRARAGIGYVPEGRRVFPGLSVKENLEVAGADSAAERRRDIDKAFALFPQLAEKQKEAAWRLSGGQQQMLAVARALMTRPRLLLLDEPTLGLAPAAAAEVASKITEVAAGGVGALIAEQSVARLPAAAMRVVAPARGRVIFDGEMKSAERENILDWVVVGSPGS
jgi:branched-chain amino acid transport system ATP-binding protein